MENAYQKADAVVEEVKKVLAGKENCIRKALAAVLAGGHILIEDVPGVGKTTLAVAFSRAMALQNNRVQFTPDVMPSDILGFHMYQKQTDTFVYYPGTVMCNLFLADEINRTSPKTQSALLEVMEEGYVTVDGERHAVPVPFHVIATQNPKGSAGTQLLPESQLDRFMICMHMGYPDMDSEIDIARGKNMQEGTDQIGAVLDAGELTQLQRQAAQAFVQEEVYEYIAKLSQATRENPYIELGVSPRGTIACTKMAKAWAFMQGRDYVLPQDVADIFLDVAKHRILLNTKARVAHMAAEAVLGEILSGVKEPVTYKTRHFGKSR